MEHFDKDIHGWFNFQSLYTEVVNRYPSGSHFVEVGSWLGKSAAFMSVEIINSKKEIRFDCVDAWEYVQGETALHNRIPASQESDSGDGGPVLSLGESAFSYAPYFEPFKNLHEKFLDNIKPVAHIINPVKSTSESAAKLYEDKSLDFIFIDADHTYESVKRDIISWRPKLKDEGIIAGHDYNYEPVKKAVKEMFGERIGTRVKRRCWIVEP